LKFKEVELKKFSDIPQESTLDGGNSSSGKPHTWSMKKVRLQKLEDV
jgi:hypothetical protein